MLSKEASSENLSFIDLFSGAGGFSTGFVQEGFHDLLAIELDEEASLTYRMNFPDSYVIHENIRDIHSLDILPKLDTTPSVIIASPPCEPFTSANTARQKKSFDRFYVDSKGDLTFHAIRIIGDLEPDFFVIENVVPILNGEGKEIIKTEFEKVNINKIHFNVIEAKNHGCPSARTRVFISNIKLNLPQFKEVTVKQAIGDLPNPSYPNIFNNHISLSFPKRVQDKIHRVKKGEAAVFFKGAVEEKKTWIRLDPDKPSDTIMGKSRFIHPFEDRPLTVREHARLMTFPDSFIFSNKIDVAFNQVGEAVPPLIARHISKKLKELLRKKG